MVEYGMTPLEATMAATKTNSELSGIQEFTGALSHEYHHSGRAFLRRPVELKIQDQGDLIYSRFEVQEIEFITGMVIQVS